MGLFRKEKHAPPLPSFPPENYEPVIRQSICTGEQVACMRERATGKLHEILFLRTEADLDSFCRAFGLRADEIKRIY